MVRRFLNSILGLFKNKGEYSLVVEEIGNRFEVTYAKVDSNHKIISILKRKKIKSLDKLQRPLRIFDKIILALNSSHATTIESLVYLKRSQPQENINEAELDHLIFRGLWEFLNHYRSWAAKKMGIADLDLVLANVDIRDVGIGTHRVFNPLGFKGADFFLRLRGTFVPRTFLNTVTNLSSWAKYAAVVEDVGIVSAAVPEPADFVVHADESKTVVFSLGEEERLYAKEIPWGLVNILSDLNQTFGIEEETARTLLDRHLQNKVSKKMEHLVQSVINKQLKKLLENLATVYNKQGKSKPRLHFNFRFTIRLPDAFYNSSKTKLVNFSKWLELQGFEINFKDRLLFPKNDAQNTLALLMHPYHYPHYDFLNQLLRRRAKWLIPNT